MSFVIMTLINGLSGFVVTDNEFRAANSSVRGLTCYPSEPPPPPSNFLLFVAVTLTVCGKSLLRVLVSLIVGIGKLLIRDLWFNVHYVSDIRKINVLI